MATAEEHSPFPVHRSAHQLLESARMNGWAVCGEGSADTTLINELGVFSKFGAEGSVVVATRDGYVAAVTSLDGSTRPVHAVALELLARAGGLTQELVASAKSSLSLTVRGGAEAVGEIIVTC